MEYWWDKVTISMKKVWNGVAFRLGIRKSGLLKLRHDVRSCEYEDVQVMWEMLKKNETGKSNKRPLWNMFEWARCTPCICSSSSII
ncbi:hypothetical protein CFOL_v3_13988 [Cephalotus follicularis]|uniref:Uncharacterized protein n=1 Tax=Cephalotus follicularis TaxID=3775 RepID=A0A1Q3BR53_CEPFO|nr:hypothetical protein CFOL_v3_13988 [Cephalotus follicularis]